MPPHSRAWNPSWIIEPNPPANNYALNRQYSPLSGALASSVANGETQRLFIERGPLGVATRKSSLLLNRWFGYVHEPTPFDQDFLIQRIIWRVWCCSQRLFPHRHAQRHFILPFQTTGSTGCEAYVDIVHHTVLWVSYTLPFYIV